MNSPYPSRKSLPHTPPIWLDTTGHVFFLTVCCRPRGGNQLARPEVWPIILETFLKYQKLGYWYVGRLLAMPDHLHALVSFPAEAFMRKRVGSFKAWTAKACGIAWQRDFFDHRLRSDESHVEKSAYIAMNPVRAGLCNKPEDWLYTWKR